MMSTQIRRTGLGRCWLGLLAGLALAGCEREREREIVTRVAALTPLAPPPAGAEAGFSTEAHPAQDLPERRPVTACSDVEKKASELAAVLPRQLDADTRATRVTATGCDLRLEYELLTLVAEEVSERGMRAMRSEVLDRLCADKGALAVMQRGGRFTNVYYDRMQAPIGLFTVAADDCGI
jgi:hypothetical protein